MLNAWNMNAGKHGSGKTCVLAYFTRWFLFRCTTKSDWNFQLKKMHLNNTGKIQVKPILLWNYYDKFPQRSTMNDIFSLFTLFSCQVNSREVKLNLKSSITSIVHELPLDLPNDLKNPERKTTLKLDAD